MQGDYKPLETGLVLYRLDRLYKVVKKTAEEGGEWRR